MESDIRHYPMYNGEKSYQPFSEVEFKNRHDNLKKVMAEKSIDACLFTSYHNICYYSGFLFCYFGRKYAAIVTHDDVTTVSAGIDGGQPWRRTVGDNIVYSDWKKDNYFRAVEQKLGGVKRLGIEYDHISLQMRDMLKEQYPHIELVDCSNEVMTLRTIKSKEEQKLIRKGADICAVGGRALMQAVKTGVSEHEVAIASTNAMIREIAKSFPFVELMDTWTWFQSGLNTDGAHNPVTNKKVEKGDILSLNTFPMIFGYYTALERTLFCEEASDAHYNYWQKNCHVHVEGMKLLKPGAKCSDIAKQLNELYADWDLLKYRSFGYGHSFGILSHYYGREAGVELREDVHTILEPNMVVSMEPMITIPEGMPGAGGYREHDILIITEDGADNITNFPFGTDEMIVGK